MNYGLETQLGITLTMIMSIVFSIMTIVGLWKIFEKCEEKGWKALIPVYNSFIEFKLFWKKKMFAVYIAIVAAYLIVYSIFIAFAINSSADFSSLGIGILAILLLALCVALIVIDIKLSIKIGRKFGVGDGFIVGLVLLSPIFMLILGLGKYMPVENATAKGINEPVNC